MNKPTPGPWQAHSDVFGLYIVGAIDGPLEDGGMNYSPICDVADTKDADANIALITAAPGLHAENEALRDKIQTLREVLQRASGWLHAAYDRPPQTPECRSMLDEVDAARGLGE
jgi:hypothetical protein